MNRWPTENHRGASNSSSERVDDLEILIRALNKNITVNIEALNEICEILGIEKKAKPLVSACEKLIVDDEFRRKTLRRFSSDKAADIVKLALLITAQYNANFGKN